MKIEIKKIVEVEAHAMAVLAQVRYWDDAIVNGVSDEDGNLIPCRKRDLWNPTIDIDSGIIKDWPLGTTAEVHYKVCDLCGFKVLGADDEILFEEKGCYVPLILCPGGKGYGDYIVMNIDSSGKIDGWRGELVALIFEETIDD
jgi:hypothetical protein